MESASSQYLLKPVQRHPKTDKSLQASLTPQRFCSCSSDVHCFGARDIELVQLLEFWDLQASSPLQIQAMLGVVRCGQPPSTKYSPSLIMP